MKKPPTTFSTIETFANAQGLPVAWIRRLAEQGKLPAIRAGRSVMVHTERSKRVLAELAESAEGGAA